jgi:long-chain acyl-CoA synthetase
MVDMTLPKHTGYWLIRKTVENYPDSIAQMYRAGGQDYSSLTFKQMFENVQAISMGLLGLGLKKGDRAALIADVGHRWIWMSLGITSIGCVDVPRGTDATEGDLKYILKHAECPVLILEHEKAYRKVEKLLGEFSSLKTIVFLDPPSGQVTTSVQIVTLSDLMEQGRKALAADPAAYSRAAEAVDESELATIIYTSGTTGNPKGVMHTQKSLIWEVDHSIRGIPVPPNGVTMGFLPPWHIAERLIEHVAIRTATAIAFTSVPTLAKDLAAARPTFLLSVPRVWESFYNRVIENVRKAPPVARALFGFARATAIQYTYLKDELLGLRYHLDKASFPVVLGRKIVALFGVVAFFVPYLAAYAILGKVRKGLGGRVAFAISGAGALPEHIDRFFYAAGISIVETYGMTETVGVTSRRNFPGTVVGTIGEPFKGVEIKLLDEKGNVVTEPNVKGVAYHRGPHIMQGYYKEPEKTKEVLKDGWLNSGDILVWTATGQLKFAGRAKDTIVLLGGENVEPQPIEDMLSQSGLIAQVVVVGQDKKSLGALIVPAVEPVRAFLAEQGVMLPDDVNTWNTITEVRELFKEEIKSRISDKNGFKNFEKVTNFHLLAREFQVGDELTQTMKVRRNVVFDKYAKEIDGLYRS